ncbi:MAG: 30S ribosomal protein S6 [Deltaproteobacteria bacterium]|jgi:small subunit ribosomal protein S6
MRNYETIIIIKPNVAEDGIAAVLDRTQGIIEGDGGSVAKIDKWGLRKLAYLIKKEQQGYYVLMEFTGTPQAVAEMERIFKIDDRILKYMTVKLTALSAPQTEEEENPEAVEASEAEE